MCLWLLARRPYCVAADDESTPVFRSDVSTGRIDSWSWTVRAAKRRLSAA